MSKLPLAGQTSAVAVVKAASYSKDLADAMLRGILECGLDVAGKTVLLKPNFVEFDPNTCINTDVAVVATALEVFRSLGAADVKIGEGPGHRRDTLAIAELTRYRSEIPKLRRCVRGSEPRRCDPGQGLRGPRRVLLSQHGAGRRSDCFAGQDEDAPLGGRDALDEEFLRPGAGVDLRMAQERAALHWHRHRRSWS